jgi:F420-non-reducing hydrogenase small subunit
MNKGDELFGTVYEKGEVIFRQGDSGDTMFIIQSGAVEVTRSSEGKDVVLAVLERGDFFGEMALLDNSPRSATVKAIQRSRLLPLNRQSLSSRARTDPAILLQVMASLIMRLEKTNRLLREVVHGSESLRRALVSDPTQRAYNGGDQVQPRTAYAEQRIQSLDPVKSLPGSEKEKQGVHEAPSVASQDFPFEIDQHACSCFEPGMDIFRQGDPGEFMYFVAEGLVEITQECEGDRFKLARLGPGDFFGEMALVTGGPRVANATAVEKTRLLAVNRDEFLAKVQIHPELGLFIVQSLISRLRSTNSAIENPRRALDVVRRALPPVLSRESKLRVAVLSLSSCGGCAASLLNDPEELHRLTDRVHIAYCPMLMDEENISEVTVAVVDGVARVKEDVEKLMEVRQKSKLLVAWGTCAVFGGIPAMANDYELETLIDNTYANALDPMAFYLAGETLTHGSAYADSGEGLLRHARKLSDFVRVDYHIAGCPPHPPILTSLVMELRGEPQSLGNKSIVCTDCPRRPSKSVLETLRVFPGAAMDSQTCLISLGSICLGFTTRGGCGAPCTTGGIPCWGCRGPSDAALKKLREGESFEELTLSALLKRCKLPQEALKGTVRDFRRKTVSSLGFHANFVKDSSRLR